MSSHADNDAIAHADVWKKMIGAKQIYRKVHLASSHVTNFGGAINDSRVD